MNTIHKHRPERSPRPGFTMIEILVVIGILALLASLSLMAFRGFIGNARVTATQTTIVKIDELLHQRMEAFTRWIDSMHVEAPGRPEYVYDSDYALMAPLGVSPGDVNYRDLAIVLARKNRFREFFPQHFGEVPAGGTFPGTGSAANQNAECLYYFIMKSQVYGIEPVEDGFFLSAEFGDTDGDGLMEFLDNWGHPIRYYRWPTRLVADVNAPLLMGSMAMTTPIDGADGQPGVAGTDDDNLNGADDPNERGWPGSDDPINDPEDPNGLVPDMLFQLENNSTPFDFELGTVSISFFHSPATYHTPLIVSAGPDGDAPADADPQRNFLGLYEPTDAPNYGHLAAPHPTYAGDLTDNITNLNSRVGGR
ncbi:MAG: prepilin-type N-terminal cleavage/methylation domain-containing protein [Planctomycetaceae bacterium]